MKICDITCLYYPHGGGVKTYIESKRLVYKQRQISHLLIAPNFDNPNQLEIKRDGSSTIYFIPCFKISLAGTSYFIFRGFKKAAEIIKQENPDVIEIGDKIITLLFKKSIKKLHKVSAARIFVFSHERADNFAQMVTGSKLVGRFFAQLFIKRFIGAGDAVITNSNFTAEEILKYLPPRKVFVLALGINVNDFDRQKCFDQKLYNDFSENGKKTLLIHVGRLDKDKKTGLLVDFAENLDADKYKLIIVGGGGYEKFIKNIPAVKFIGYRPHEEVKKYLAVADLGILVNNIEPYGLVGLEMMAMSLPVLGPNQGGLTTFLKKDFAWLLPYNKQAYLDVLRQWREMSDTEKQAMSKLARQEAEKYTLENMVDNLIKVYESYK